MHDPKKKAEHRAQSARGGRGSWRERLNRVGEGTPWGALLSYLTETMTVLSRSKLDSDGISQERAKIYAVSTAIRLLESSELEDAVEELNRRLDAFEDRGGNHA